VPHFWFLLRIRGNRPFPFHFPFPATDSKFEIRNQRAHRLHSMYPYIKQQTKVQSANKEKNNNKLGWYYIVDCLILGTCIRWHFMSFL
jgi:hypothetical protein